MKTISNVLTGILLSSALFTACSKDDGNMAVNPAAPAANAKGFTDQLNFKNGGITTSSILITSNDRTIYQLEQAQNLDLASSVYNLKLNPGVYKNLSARISTTRNADTKDQLWLTDQVVLPNGSKPMVKFVMNYPMKLKTIPGDFLVTDATTIMDLLHIKTEVLASGITNDMLMEADRQGDIIRISQDSNPHLYKMILEKLNTMVAISYQNTDPDPWKTANTAPGPRMSPVPDPSIR